MTDPLTELFGNDADPAGSGQSQGGKLRQLLEQTLEENKQFRERLAAQEAAARANALSAAFEKHQIPELARDFFPKDAEPTEQSISAFQEKYGALWGYQPPGATTDPQQQQQTDLIQNFQQTAPPAQSFSSEEQFAAAVGEAKTKEEVLSLMQRAGELVTT